MAGWPYSKRRWRDRIRADYLERTGKAEFDRDDFLEWLRHQPEHRAEVERAAWAQIDELARRFVSDLRIEVAPR